MQNTLKRIVICLLVVAICCGFALFAVACNNNQNNDNNGNTDYVVKVQDENGTAVTTGTGPNNALLVQLCIVKANGETGACSTPKAVDQNATVTFTASELENFKLGEGEKYHVVVSKFTDNYEYDAEAEGTYISAPGTVTITLKAKQQQPVEELTTFTATVLYNTDKPLAGAKFGICYYDSKAGVNSDTLAEATTDANGVATFKIETIENVSYKVSHVGLSTKYEYISGDTFDSNHQTTLLYKFYPNGFTYGDTQQLAYTRAAVKDGEPKVEYKALELNLKSELYDYFYFNPYVANEDFTANESAAAASGEYKISFSVEGTATVELNYYDGSFMFIQVDENHIPMYVVESVSNGGAINIELSSSDNNMSFIFGIKASADCKVTVSVERTGDYSYVVPNPVVTTVQPTVTIAEVGNNDLEQGNLTLVPIDGSANLVKANGVYHLGSADGPIVYVTLNAPVGRVSNIAISDYSTSTEKTTGCFVYTTENDRKGNPTKQNDYLELVNAYAEKATNDEGLYPLNDDLLAFLKNFAQDTLLALNPNGYLGVCKYFSTGEAGGNVLKVGDNTVVLTNENHYDGVTYVFTSVNGGSFTISIENIAANADVFISDENFENDLIGDGTYSYNFTLQAGESISFVVWNISSACTVKVTISGGNEPVVEDTTLKLGDNTVKVKPEDALGGKKYTFTATAAGWYAISIDGSNENALVLKELDGFEAYLSTGEGLLEYKFELAAGQTIEFYVAYLDADIENEVSYVVNLATTEAPQPSTISVDGGTVDLSLNSFYFECDEAGKYLFTLGSLPQSLGMSGLTIQLGSTQYTFQYGALAVEVTIASSNIDKNGKVEFKILNKADAEVEFTVAPLFVNIEYGGSGNVNLSWNKFYAMWGDPGMYRVTFDVSDVENTSTLIISLDIGDRLYTFSAANDFSNIVIIAEEDNEDYIAEFKIVAGYNGTLEANFLRWKDYGFDLELGVGDKLLYLESYEEVEFTFTASTAGWYAISSNKYPDVFVEDEDGNELLNDEESSGKFELEAGETICFYVKYKGDYDYEFVRLTIETTSAPVVAAPSTITLGGGEVNFTDFSKFYFEVAEAGTYNFTLTDDVYMLQINFNDVPYLFNNSNNRSCNITISEDDIFEGKVEFNFTGYSMNNSFVTVLLVSDFASNGGAVDLRKGSQILLFDCAEAGTYTFTIDATNIPNFDANGVDISITVGNNTEKYTFKKFPQADNVNDIVIAESDIKNGKVTLHFVLDATTTTNYSVSFTVEKQQAGDDDEVTLLGTWEAKSGTDASADTLTLEIKADGTIVLTCTDSSYSGTVNYTAQSGTLVDTGSYNGWNSLTITFNNGELRVTLGDGWNDLFDNVKFTKIAEPVSNPLLGNWTSGDLTLAIGENSIAVTHATNSDLNATVSYTAPEIVDGITQYALYGSLGYGGTQYTDGGWYYLQVIYNSSNNTLSVSITDEEDEEYFNGTLTKQA